MFDPGPNDKTEAIAAIVTELRALNRIRVAAMKSRNAAEQPIRAYLASTKGYSASLDEESRKEMFKGAADFIANVRKQMKAGEFVPGKDRHADFALSGIQAVEVLEDHMHRIETSMVKLVRQLPIHAWVEHADQKGFGELSLAKVIGECGNLSDYSKPGKLWKRMGCAPITKDGKTMMGSTWRYGKEGKLSAEEWEKAGYSPTRRSLAYLIGEGLVKQNGDGPYRTLYDEKKADLLANRPDWTTCPGCNGEGETKPEGKKKAAKCKRCAGSGELKKRCHLTAMLVATKRLLKNLWKEWNKDTGMVIENHEEQFVGVA